MRDRTTLDMSKGTCHVRLISESIGHRGLVRSTTHRSTPSIGRIRLRSWCSLGGADTLGACKVISCGKTRQISYYTIVLHVRYTEVLRRLSSIAVLVEIIVIRVNIIE